MTSEALHRDSCIWKRGFPGIEFLHVEEAGERWPVHTRVRINGLGRRPGELYVGGKGIPTFGGGRREAAWEALHRDSYIGRKKKEIMYLVERGPARMCVRINGLGRRPGELYIGIPAFGEIH